MIPQGRERLGVCCGQRWEGTRRHLGINAATLLELRRYMEEMWQDAMQAFARRVIQKVAKTWPK